MLFLEIDRDVPQRLVTVSFGTTPHDSKAMLDEVHQRVANPTCDR